VLYELMALRRPFDAASLPALILQITRWVDTVWEEAWCSYQASNSLPVFRAAEEVDVGGGGTHPQHWPSVVGVSKLTKTPTATQFARRPRGQYAPLPSNYSPELAALASALLRQSPAERPGAEEVLALPIVRGHLMRYVRHVER
jgi:hypothetical protein